MSALFNARARDVLTATGPRSFLRRLRDVRDERGACRLRRACGLRGCLVSWEPGDLGGWRSRISCPGLVYTVERDGPTRVAAIRRGLRARERILALRDALRDDPGPVGPGDIP